MNTMSQSEWEHKRAMEQKSRSEQAEIDIKEFEKELKALMKKYDVSIGCREVYTLNDYGEEVLYEDVPLSFYKYGNYIYLSSLKEEI